MAAIDISSTAAPLNDGVLQLQNGVAMDSTLRSVTDQNNTASTLKLSTTSAQFTSPLRITTDDPSDFYLDCEDGSTNNRFSITRNTASQQVNLNFASNPGGSTTIVGAIRTFTDGVNLSEVMAFREDGQTFVTGNTTIGNGTTAIASRLAIKGSGSTSATTSLLVQNSAGATSLKVTDDGSVTNNGKNSLTGNTAFGTNALISVTSGNFNSAFGVDALSFNTSGQLNNAFGRECLLFNSTGGNNAAYGNQALLFNSSASFNAAFGVSCLSGNTTGASNSSIGYNTSSGNFSGSVILGREATATANNQFVVGSTTVNAGTVTAEINTSTNVWNVVINGVARKILLA